MLIFYPQNGEVVTPVVVLDALDSSDRFTDAEVLICCYKYAPDEISIIAKPEIYSCTYEFVFSHNGIPLGEGIKTRFTGTISSPPASLVSQFSPKFFSSAQSAAEIADAFSPIANPQSSITYAALVVLDQLNNFVARKFVAYSAQVFPDPFGSTTTMVVNGASLEDMIIKQGVAFILDTLQPLATQLSAMLSRVGYTAVFNSSLTEKPVADKMFPPARLREILDEVCLQNKLISSISDLKVVTFYSQSDAPLSASNNAKFSFLGYTGALAWGLGVENYVNVKFKTPYFDAQLFQPVTLYNDIKSAFFDGLPKKSIVTAAVDAYDAYIIRYSLIRNAGEIVTEITASSNWLLAQTRIDGILESRVYAPALGAGA